MALALAADSQIAIKRQSGLGVPASGSGAAGYNVFASQSLKLTKSIIQNGVVRRDRQAARGRHGGRSSGAVYKLPLSQGTLDPLFEAALGGTFTPTFDITNATTLGGSAAATSITCQTASITAAAGSWLLQGLRKGMRIKLTGQAQAGNNGKWLRVLDVSALVITLPAASLIVDATPDATFTVSVAKSLTNPTTFLERYHTVEDYSQGIGKGILGVDMKVCKIEFSAQPDALIEITVTFMGLDANPQTSNILTTPTYATTIPLVMMDGTIRIGGVDQTVMAGMQWTWDCGGATPRTLSKLSPDVILDQGKLSGSFSALRQDLTFMTAFSAETVTDFHLDCVEPDIADPKDFTSFYFGNTTLSDFNPSGVAQNGAETDTIPWAAGIDDSNGAAALTSMLISSSAP